MFNKKEPVRNVSESRKNSYRIGQVFLVIGVLLFLSNFVFFAADFGDFRNFKGKMQRSMGMSIGGMVLIFIGIILMRAGRYGKAGGGFILDPEQERRDKEPLNRSLGGQISDMLDEAGIAGIGGKKEVIKVRCRHCQSLNDETDKFCGQCGQAL